MRLGRNHYQVFYSPEGAAGADGGVAPDRDGSDNAGNGAGAGGGAGGNSGRSGAGSEEPAWLPKRLDRAKLAGREALLAELGIGPDELGTVKDALAKRRGEESEATKEKRRREAIEKDFAKLTADLAAFQQREQSRTVADALRSAVSKEAAAGRHVIDPEALVLELSDSRRDHYLGFADDSLAVFENGSPVRGKDAHALVKAHLDGRAHLLRPVHPEGGAGTRSTAAGGTKDPAPVDLARATFAEKAAAIKADPRYQAMAEKTRKGKG